MTDETQKAFYHKYYLNRKDKHNAYSKKYHKKNKKAISAYKKKLYLDITLDPLIQTILIGILRKPS